MEARKTESQFNKFLVEMRTTISFFFQSEMIVNNNLIILTEH